MKIIKRIWFRLRYDRRVLVILSLFILTSIILGSFHFVFYKVFDAEKQVQFLRSRPYLVKLLPVIRTVRKINDVLYLPYYFKKSELPVYELYIDLEDIEKMKESLPPIEFGAEEFYIDKIFVPAKFAKDACLEALENNLNLCIITEGIPVNDMIEVMKNKGDNIIIGPNCPGVCDVGGQKLGIMPNHLFKAGNVGIVSRSGTLTYEIVDILTKAGIGQSSVVGIGGDMIIGSDFIDVLKYFEKDEKTTHIVLLGEIGGDSEERAAEYIKEIVSKPVIAYIAGKQAPKGKTMGHAGAVIYGNKGTAESKIKALQDNGVKVVQLPSEIIKKLK